MSAQYLLPVLVENGNVLHLVHTEPVERRDIRIVCDCGTLSEETTIFLSREAHQAWFFAMPERDRLVLSVFANLIEGGEGNTTLIDSCPSCEKVLMAEIKMHTKIPDNEKAEDAA